MAWKVKGVLLNSDGTIYAGKGDILPEDDPVALSKPNLVTHVHADGEWVVPTPSVVFSGETSPVDLVPGEERVHFESTDYGHEEDSEDPFTI